MENKYLVNADNAVLAVIDYQERLMPVMENELEIADKAIRMINGAKELNLPVLVTQQYTLGLGNTIEPIKEALGDLGFIEKKSFSAYREGEFLKALEATGKKEVILMGIESHICVMQTAFDLLNAGYKINILEDCCSSRTETDNFSALDRMSRAGINCTTVEAVLMEMIGGAHHKSFKAISRIIK